MHLTGRSHPSPATESEGATHWTRAHITALGEFLAEERWIATRHPYSAPIDDLDPVRMRADDSNDDDEAENDHALGLLLGVIADDVHKFAAAARDGIVADFAARVAHARKHLPRHQLAAALHGLAEARKAALAAVTQNAALELASRKKAAIEARPRRRVRARQTARTSSFVVTSLR